MNETLVTLVGNIISEVARREGTDGDGPVRFRMATNERRYDKATGTWGDGDRFYVWVTCWRRLADGVQLSLEKGDPVIVKGRMYTGRFQVDGANRSATEVEAYAVGPDVSRCTARPVRAYKEAVSDVPPEVQPATEVPEQAVSEQATAPAAPF